MEEGGTEKTSGGRFARATRKTDEGREQARLGHGAKHVLKPTRRADGGMPPTEETMP